MSSKGASKPLPPSYKSSTDLIKLYKEWTDAPKFTGHVGKSDTKKWLKTIETGLKERKVPKDLWSEAAQHYMSHKARNRLVKVQEVLRHLRGNTGIEWKWSKFKGLVESICWDIPDESEPVMLRIGRAVWDTLGLKSQPAPAPPPVSTTPLWLHRLPNLPTLSIIVLSKGKESKPEAVKKTTQTVKTTQPDEPILDYVANAPAWLLHTCLSSALQPLINAHPTAMDIFAAVLIAAGSAPLMPQVATGAAGAFLASPVVHAIGSAAVAVGTTVAAGRRVSKEKIKER